MRTWLTFAMLLVLVACSAPTATGAPPTTDVPAADALAVSVADFMIDPAEAEVAGPTVTISVTNDGPTPHNLTVRDGAGDVVMGTEDLSVGDSETITAELEPGAYTIFCALPGHESLGMTGTLTVTAP
jgi:plastocyanin